MVAMEHVGVHVGPVGPDDRSELRVDAHLPEELLILAQRLEHGPSKLVLEVDVTRGAVVEAEPQNEACERLHGGDPGCLRPRAHGSGSIRRRR